MYPIVKGNRRHRYIGFVVKHLGNDFNRSEMLGELREQCKCIFNKDCKEMGIRLIRFDGTAGIVKCSHVEKENTMMILRSIKKIASKKVEVKTIATSGTIRSLIKKHMANFIVFL